MKSQFIFLGALLSLGVLLSSCNIDMGGGSLFSFSSQSKSAGSSKEGSSLSKEEQKSITAYLLEDSADKTSQSLDALPNLPSDAGVVRPTAENTELVYLCAEGSTALRKFSYRWGYIGTDVQSDFKVYMRDTFDFAYEIGHVSLPGGKNYMIAFQDGRPNPIFYIDMETKPTLLDPNYERPFPPSVLISNSVFSDSNVEKSSVSEESLRDQSYSLNTLADSSSPECGKPSDPPPSTPSPTQVDFSKLVDKELKMFFAQLKTNIDGGELLQKLSESKQCISALQVFGSSFKSFAKLNVNQVLSGSGINSNNLQGHTFRNVCSPNTVVALTKLGQDLTLNGLKSYVMRINTTVPADYPVDQLIVRPSMEFLKEQQWDELPLRKNVKLSPYVSEVLDYGDAKAITAYVPLSDLVDCDAVLARGKELYPDYPNVTHSKSLEGMGVFHTDLKYRVSYVDGEESVGEGCEGGGPIKSPLVISFQPVRSGVVTQSRAVEFDLNGDGVKESLSGWPMARSHLGFLVLGDGKSMSGKKLFGTETDLSDFGLGQGFADGHEALAQLDQNGDGVINAKDKVKDRSVIDFLSVWFDRNGNAVVDRGEVAPLRLFGVRSLSLQVFSIPEKVVKGDGSITTKSSIRFKGIRSLPVYDLWFKVK